GVWPERPSFYKLTSKQNARRSDWTTARLADGGMAGAAVFLQAHIEAKRQTLGLDYRTTG
ncbi:MAG: hypothetical protein QNJ22_20065, partial [Desulfosarcinaceae bacterium]|nr:hypothetical protein [Desulfosarcinaceae bacterium]